MQALVDTVADVHAEWLDRRSARTGSVMPKKPSRPAKPKTTSSLDPKIGVGQTIGAAVGPAAKNFGKEIAPLGSTAGQLVNRAAHVLMRPVFGVIWGAERLSDWINEKIEPRVHNIPEENRVEPDMQIAASALEAVRTLDGKENLRDMFANLLSNAMDSRVKGEIHPSYVEVLKQISVDEAKIIMKLHNGPSLPIMTLSKKKEGTSIVPIVVHYSDIALQSKCENPIMTRVYIENLDRLGVLSAKYTGNYHFDIVGTSGRRNWTGRHC
ncbi:DUF4393 domain-containing protein [Phreatobacter sp.]|uniref:DUF4393 domain-containing protein n=1 Tax=Phreatobacter sp. TaxID=1966341 RepID=UPI003F705EE3